MKSRRLAVMRALAPPRSRVTLLAFVSIPYRPNMRDGRRQEHSIGSIAAVTSFERVFGPPFSLRRLCSAVPTTVSAVLWLCTRRERFTAIEFELHAKGTFDALRRAPRSGGPLKTESLPRRDSTVCWDVLEWPQLLRLQDQGRERKGRRRQDLASPHAVKPQAQVHTSWRLSGMMTKDEGRRDDGLRENGRH